MSLPDLHRTVQLPAAIAFSPMQRNASARGLAMYQVYVEKNLRLAERAGDPSRQWWAHELAALKAAQEKIGPAVWPAVKGVHEP